MTNFAIPFVIRETVSQLEQMLQIRLGVPMNGKIPSEEKRDGEAVIQLYFPGRRFKMKVVMHDDSHFGLSMSPKEISGVISGERKGLETFIERIRLYVGSMIEFSIEEKLDYVSGEFTLRFTIFEAGVKCLDMNASNRRNDLPAYEWGQKGHPLFHA